MLTILGENYRTIPLHLYTLTSHPYVVLSQTVATNYRNIYLYRMYL